MGKDKSEKKRKREKEEARVQAVEDEGMLQKKKKKKHRTEPRENAMKVVLADEVGPWRPIIATTPGCELPDGLKLEPYVKSARPATATRSGAIHSFQGGLSQVSKASGAIAVNDSTDESDNETPEPISNRNTREQGDSVTTIPNGAELVLHSSQHPRLDYFAREERSGMANDTLQHFLGIFDPTSRELFMIPAKQMVVRPVPRAEEPEDGQSPAEETNQTELEARNQLNEEFGSRRIKKLLRSRAANAIDSSQNDRRNSDGNVILDDDAAAVLDAAAATGVRAPFATREEMRAIVNGGKPVPRVENPLAESPAEVYTLEGLIGEETLQVLGVRHWQETIRAKKDVPTASRFVSRRLAALAASDANTKKLKALRFMLVLIQFSRFARPSQSRRPTKLPTMAQMKNMITDVDTMVILAVKEKFANQENFVSKWSFDYLLTHICAIALVLDNYQTLLMDLLEDLRLDLKVLIQYYQELGCKVSKPTQKEREKWKISVGEGTIARVATLKIPLKFPAAKIPNMMRR